MANVQLTESRIMGEIRQHKENKHGITPYWCKEGAS